jgi:hypothetical protein
MTNLDYTAGLSVTASRALVDQHMREDLSAFTYRAFEIIAPGEELLPNWHIGAITYRLEQVRRKKVKRLMITMPPATLNQLLPRLPFRPSCLVMTQHSKLLP